MIPEDVLNSVSAEKNFLAKKQHFATNANQDRLNSNTFDERPMLDAEDLKTKPYLAGAKIRKINLHVGSFVKIESTGILLIRLQMIPNEIDVEKYTSTKKQEMRILESAMDYRAVDNDPYYNPHIPNEKINYTNTHIIDFVK